MIITEYEWICIVKYIKHHKDQTTTQTCLEVKKDNKTNIDSQLDPAGNEVPDYSTLQKPAMWRRLQESRFFFFVIPFRSLTASFPLKSSPP